MARLSEQLEKLVQGGKPVLGICNGFQVLVETGLLPDRTVGKRGSAPPEQLGGIESRWVDVLVTDTSSIWTKGLDGRTLRIPVAHGEGRLYWEVGHSVHGALAYAENGVPTERYPANPNGTPGGIAGIRDDSGLIFGSMPHPELGTRLARLHGMGWNC